VSKIELESDDAELRMGPGLSSIKIFPVSMIKSDHRPEAES
jgi:hypothetical protein